MPVMPGLEEAFCFVHQGAPADQFYLRQSKIFRAVGEDIEADGNQGAGSEIPLMKNTFKKILRNVKGP